jgi:hypothetical protein
VNILKGNIYSFRSKIGLKKSQRQRYRFISFCKFNFVRSKKMVLGIFSRYFPRNFSEFSEALRDGESICHLMKCINEASVPLIYEKPQGVVIWLILFIGRSKE